MEVDFWGCSRSGVFSFILLVSGTGKTSKSRAQRLNHNLQHEKHKRNCNRHFSQRYDDTREARNVIPLMYRWFSESPKSSQIKIWSKSTESWFLECTRSRAGQKNLRLVNHVSQLDVFSSIQYLSARAGIQRKITVLKRPFNLWEDCEFHDSDVVLNDVLKQKASGN